mmetsp:Transcript_10288/g.9936  ORF Transcript_10288/g.9936 Transcript_10288/m.9936 type:complete len:237 (-) Transcript_10288:210-920(-)
MMNNTTHDCILTAGEGNNNNNNNNNNNLVSIWDPKQLKLVDTIPWPSSPKNNSNNKSNNNHKSYTWEVSTMKPTNNNNTNNNNNNSDWFVFGGGIQQNNRTSKYGGFLATLHLPTRTINSVQMTRERIQNIHVSSQDDDQIYSIGNEGVLSCWNNASNIQNRTGRAWLTTPSAYAISKQNNNDNNDNGGLLAIAGKGITIDCFSIPNIRDNMNHHIHYEEGNHSCLGTKSLSLVLH